MELTDTLYVTNREAWRAWLEAHHASEKVVWLIFYKKSSGQAGIAYDEAVEEALCYGWIDSIVKKVDEERRAQKFTPRKPKSNWSESNKQRVRKLIEAGRMTEAGLAKIGSALENVEPKPEIIQPKPAPAIQSELEEALANNQKASENFDRFTPAYKALALKWITAAKKAETRARRIEEFIQLTADNKKIGLK